MSGVKGKTHVRGKDRKLMLELREKTHVQGKRENYYQR